MELGIEMNTCPKTSMRIPRQVTVKQWLTKFESLMMVSRFSISENLSGIVTVVFVFYSFT